VIRGLRDALKGPSCKIDIRWLTRRPCQRWTRSSRTPPLLYIT